MAQPVPERRLDTFVWPIAAALAECLCMENTASGLPEPCFCGVAPGAEMALDSLGGPGCCTATKNGQLWVRVGSVYPSSAPPEIDEAATCNTSLAVTFEVAAVRCMTPGDSRGNPPTGAQYAAATELQLADMAMMRRAILCCMKGQTDLVGGYVLAEYEPYGPAGGVVGGDWNVTVWG